jgi:hypothetical protein
MALFLFSVFLMFAVVSGLAGKSGSTVGRTIAAGADLSQVRTELATLEARRAKVTNPDVRDAIDDRIAAAKDRVTELDSRIRSGVAAAEAKAEQRPQIHGAKVDTGFEWLDEAIGHAATNPELLAYKMKSNAYKFSWALIPISLPFIWLLFAFRRDVGLYDHAIFAIYSLAFMSLGVVALLVLGRIGVPAWILWTAATIVPPVHMYKQLKLTYGLGRFGAGWRTLTLLVITSITTSLFLAFLFYLGME